MKSLVAIAVLLTGCSLYTGGGGGDDTCYSTPPSTDTNEYLRDPQTGQCENYSYGGSAVSCGAPVPDVGGIAIPALDWGTCDGACEQLSETACLTASGCRAAYLDLNGLYTADGTPVTEAPQFWGCWETAPSGPIEGGGCAGLDDQTCSEHDDCIALYSEPALGGDVGADTSVVTTFERCAPEGGDVACGSATCGSGYTCVDNCSDGAPGSDGSLLCAPQCVATLDPGSCTGTLTCDSTAPACPANSEAGIANGCYTGYCIPVADCGPHDPGTCTNSGGAMCALAPPACPANTVPGISDGCWSGYCIPSAQCPALPCGDLMSETACDARVDCEAVYVGQNCTCEGGSCTCANETYDHCDVSEDSGTGSGSAVVDPTAGGL